MSSGGGRQAGAGEPWPWSGVAQPEQQAAGRERRDGQAASTPRPAQGLSGRAPRPVLAWIFRPAVIGDALRDAFEVRLQRR
jgi:hypothetical protein